MSSQHVQFTGLPTSNSNELVNPSINDLSLQQQQQLALEKKKIKPSKPKSKPASSTQQSNLPSGDKSKATSVKAKKVCKSPAKKRPRTSPIWKYSTADPNESITTNDDGQEIWICSLCTGKKTSYLLSGGTAAPIRHLSRAHNIPLPQTSKPRRFHAKHNSESSINIQSSNPSTIFNNVAARVNNSNSTPSTPTSNSTNRLPLNVNGKNIPAATPVSSLSLSSKHSTNEDTPDNRQQQQPAPALPMGQSAAPPQLMSTPMNYYQYNALTPNARIIQGAARPMINSAEALALATGCISQFPNEDLNTQLRKSFHFPPTPTTPKNSNSNNNSSSNLAAVGLMSPYSFASSNNASHLRHSKSFSDTLITCTLPTQFITPDAMITPPLNGEEDLGFSRVQYNQTYNSNPTPETSSHSSPIKMESNPIGFGFTDLGNGQALNSTMLFEPQYMDELSFTNTTVFPITQGITNIQTTEKENNTVTENASTTSDSEKESKNALLLSTAAPSSTVPSSPQNVTLDENSVAPAPPQFAMGNTVITTPNPSSSPSSSNNIANSGNNNNNNYTYIFNNNNAQLTVNDDWYYPGLDSPIQQENNNNNQFIITPSSASSSIISNVTTAAPMQLIGFDKTNAMNNGNFNAGMIDSLPTEYLM